MTMTKFAAKTASMTGLHMVMASVAAFVMTGSFAASVAVALLEAVLMAFAHPLHDWAWKKAPALARTRSTSGSQAENVHFV
jgi:uncharacterized membrane protein